MSEQLKAEALQRIQDAIDAPHGEIFQSCYDPSEEPTSLVDLTTEIMREQLEIEEDDRSWISPEGVESEDAAVVWWKEYFTRYPAHGENAGLVCGVLVEKERWQDVIDILKVCSDSGWDS